jgi:hypothetical protein
MDGFIHCSSIVIYNLRMRRNRLFYNFEGIMPKLWTYFHSYLKLRQYHIWTESRKQKVVMNKGSYINFPSLSQNTWQKQFKRKKSLFWLMLSEVSIHGHMALVLLGLWWGRTWWGSRWGYEVVHAVVDRRQQRRRHRGHNISFRGTPMTYFFQVDPPPKACPFPNTVIRWQLSP